VDVGKKASEGGFDGSDNDEAEELTMNDFSHLLDTLGSQPKVSRADSEEIREFSLELGRISSTISNALNGIAAATHSEQGPRPSQEDRCVVYPDVFALLGKDNVKSELAADFSRVSIACIFDGHSGHLTAQLLIEKLFKRLISSEMFLKQQWKDAIVETFRKVDEEVRTA
jgi:hypothetical protein